jgi:hypothetical protein
MAKSLLKLSVQVRCRWWLQYYLLGVRLMSILLERDPDWVRVERMIKKGLVLSVKPVPLDGR